MPFMQPDVQFGDWYEVDGPNGTEFIPADLVGNYDPADFDADADNAIPEALSDYAENRTAYSISMRSGWGARLSAPGYMDCTEWSVFDTEAEATEFAADEAGDDDDDSDEESDDADSDDCWEVVVGNVGTVYSGDNEYVARAEFAVYVGTSATGNGRAGNEDVSLLHDGNICAECIAPADRTLLGDDADNLDCSDPADLDGYADDNRKPLELRQYAIIKAQAMRLRLAGNVSAALELEKLGERVYNSLAAALKW